MTLLETLRKNMTPDLFTQVMDAVGDDFDWDLVPRSRLNKVIKQRNELREQLAGKSQPQDGEATEKSEDSDDDAQGNVSTSVDVKALERQWQDRQDKAVQEVKVQYAALEKLRAANAIDAELIWNGGVIDRSKLSLDASGALVGMEDILAQLQKDKGHLFGKVEKDVPAGTGKEGGEPFRGVTTKEEFLKLDADKQLEFKQANPTLFKQFLNS